MINYKEVEERWQRAWGDAHLFESDVQSKEPYMITAAFPYANAPQHIGHLRTFGTADVLARYKRMMGFNVLYPMAFHATGTPVLAFAKRIKENDKELIDEFKAFHIPDAEIRKMADPVYMVNYFINEIEKGMHLSGYSIDWRRKFVSIDPVFSKLIEWQFGILNSKGLLVKGNHAVGWCPNENNAVGMHDTKHDVEPEIDKEMVIKFRIENEDSYIICATYRPETIFGVTNIFVDEKAKYVKCKINNLDQFYIISKASSEILKYQLSIELLEEIDGRALLLKKCINPANNVAVPIFPGFFVKEDIGTGVVMSVPAHAPFDYVALERLKNSGYDIGTITPIKVLETEIGGSLGTETNITKPRRLDMPALAYLEMINAGIDSIDDMLENATKLEYKEESHYGKMIMEGFRGMSEPQARDSITQSFLKEGKAFEIYALTNEQKVYCRCGYGVVVKVVDNQWFINYGDAEWKDAVNRAFKDISVLPEKSKNAFHAAIDWINMRAVVRAQGLGTRFPFEKEYIIESLSDSTIYMSFYTICNIIKGIDPAKLTSEFFDYVMLGKGDAESVSRATGIPYDTVKKCSESFTYWYRRTSRHSGPDLIFNHLTMYIFNHVIIFHNEYWPKQIVVNGSVLSEGEKMSKSLGNIIPLVDGMEKHGVDPLRVAVVAGADLFSDSEFNDDAINGVKERFEYLYNACSNLNNYSSEELRQIDYWLYSKLNRKVDETTVAMEKLELRNASTNILYNTNIELRRYFARGGKNNIVLRDFLSKVVLMLQPIAPHISEELWHMLGNNSFTSTEMWPNLDKSMMNQKAEDGEQLLDDTIADAKQIIELMKKKGKKDIKGMRIIIADSWKEDINAIVAKYKGINEAMKSLDEKQGINKENASKYIKGLANKANEIKQASLPQNEEYNIFKDAKDYIKGIFNIEVMVEKEAESKSQRALRASPLKPSIDLY